MVWRDENKFDPLVHSAAALYQVPVPLIKAVIGQESAFKPAAFLAEPRIDDASRGLMQVLLRTARRLGYTGPTDDLFDPETSILLGTKLLAANYRQARGNWDVAISAYNAGFSSSRPWDGKREDAGFKFINQSYVDRVKDNWTYFETGRRPVGAADIGVLAGLLVVGVLASYFFQTVVGSPNFWQGVNVTALVTVAYGAGRVLQRLTRVERDVRDITEWLRKRWG